MRHQNVLLKAVFPLAMVASLNGCFMETEEPRNGRIEAALEPGRLESGLIESDDSERFSLVYEEVKTRKASETNFDVVDVVGTLTPEQIQRIARPYRHLSPDEEWVYNEDAWSSVDENGNVEKGYRIMRRPNDNPYSPAPDLRPARLHEELEKQLLNRDDSIFRVLIQVRDFPEWDIPIMTREGFTSVAEYQRLQDERDSKIVDRKTLLTQKSEDIFTYINSVNGTVIREAWSVGYIIADINKDEIRGLLNVRGGSVVESDFMPNDGNQQGFFVGDHDLDTRTDVEDFFNEGYEGGQPNTGRHGYYDMLAAVIESNYFEDEACSFQDGANNCGNHSTDRIRGTWNCAGGCSVVSTFLTIDEQNGSPNCINCTSNCPSACTASHGTLVATILGGDYTQGQADGKSLDDPAWISGAHTAAWENTSSGIATETNLLLLGGVYRSNSAKQSAFQVVTNEHADVANASWGSTDCDITSTQAYEDELENAYDDGVFIAVGAGNNQGPISTTCNVNSPADTPKAFAVNGLRTDTTLCDADYDSCFTDPSNSARGGGSLTVNGGAHTASLIDVTAPARLRRRTSWGTGFPNGRVIEAPVGGTSIASPIVAGAALVMKDFMLSDGFTFFNYPGRLQAIMLAMADGWQDVFQKDYGVDIYSGPGRLKTRLFDASAASVNKVTGPFTWRLRTHTFTSAGTSVFFLKSTPMSAGTTFAKCVMWEGEDMSSKSDVSDVYLTMSVKSPVWGGCNTAGAGYKSVNDTSWDIRHTTRLEDPNLSGKCLQVELHRGHITNSGTTVNTFCYSAGEADDED